MDQARNIINSYIPATQWAMNYLNHNIAQPVGQATGNFTKGFNELPQDVPMDAGFFENTGNAAANATPAGATESGLLKGAHALTNSHMLPLALGLVGNQAKFGNVLRNAQKGFNMPIHPDDVKEIAPALERILSTDPSNAHYFINQLPQDHSVIGPIAEHYMPGVTKTLKNDPVNIAQALLNRIITDRQ